MKEAEGHTKEQLNQEGSVRVRHPDGRTVGEANILDFSRDECLANAALWATAPSLVVENKQQRVEIKRLWGAVEKMEASALEVTEAADQEIADLHDAMRKGRERSEAEIRHLRGGLSGIRDYRGRSSAIEEDEPDGYIEQCLRRIARETLAEKS